MTEPQIFWLHIKKCGGTSFRDSFSSFYNVCEDRYKNPHPFISQPKPFWNDILNNYRTPLGTYDYKRMQFAKKFLYSEEEFKSMYKFVIVRNPYDRIVSAWKYLFRVKVYDFRLLLMKYNFVYFLNNLGYFWDVKYQQFLHNRYVGLHTAPVWPDMTDEDGTLLVDDIFKLENLDEDIKKLETVLQKSDLKLSHKNKSTRSHDYKKYYNRKSIRLVEKLFEEDIKNLNYSFDGNE